MRLLLVGCFLFASAASVGCSPDPSCALPCPELALTVTDDVEWTIASFHVRMCVGSVCDETDVVKDADHATPLPDLGGSVTIRTSATPGQSDFVATIPEQTDAGASYQMNDAVHVVVTNPTDGTVICDDMGTVPAPSTVTTCGRSCSGRLLHL